MKYMLRFILIVVVLSVPKHAQTASSVNVTFCVASLHRDPEGKDQFNPGVGLEYFASLPNYKIGTLTPYVAVGGAYCKDSNYLSPDGHRYDSYLPNRAYLHADAGLEFKLTDALKMGAALRLAAANYRSVGELMNLPHVGQFAIAPVPDFRFSVEPKALGIDEGSTLGLVLDHLSLDVTTAIDPRQSKGGFVGFAINWSIPLN
jgi:hypothetical protein